MKAFRVLGTSSDFSGGVNASIMFNHRDLGNIVLECGSGVYGVLKRSGKLKQASSVIVTSLQDHSIASLQTLILGRWREYGYKTRVYMPTRLLQDLSHRLYATGIPSGIWVPSNHRSIAFQSTTDLWHSGMPTYAVMIEDHNYSMLWSGYCCLPIVRVLQKDNPGLLNAFNKANVSLVMQDVTLKQEESASHCHYNELKDYLVRYYHYSFGHHKDQCEKLRKNTSGQLSCLSLWNNR